MSKNPGNFVKTRISQSLSGAWKNKLEFQHVYEGIYGDSVSQRESLSRMKLWRSRLMSLTPAGVLATLTILDISLKDKNGGLDQDDLRTMYATALVRFLNCVHSTARSAKSLYSVAKDVGLASYVVDLRHSCSHGQNLPSLETFRQVFSYCLEWLKSFYWEPQLTIMQDARIEDVLRNNKTTFEKTLHTLFRAYDFISEGLRMNKKLFSEIPKEGIANQDFLQWAKDVGPDEELQTLQEDLLNSIFSAVSAEQQVREIAQLFTEAFLECDLLVKSPAKEEDVSVTEIHQMLFRKIADWAFTPNCLTALLEIAENEQESRERREGASYWCQRLIESFMALQELKKVYKKNKDADPSVNLDFSSINTVSGDPVLMSSYAEMGIVEESSLIFADSIRRPWTLRFSREFLKQRALKASTFTVKMLENFLELADPPLDPTEQKNFVEIAKKIFITEELGEKQETTSDRIYTLDDVLEKSKKTEEEDSTQEESYGIWSECPSDINWSACPLGKLPW